MNKNMVSNENMQQFRVDTHQVCSQGGKEYGAKVNHQRQFFGGIKKLGDVFQNNKDIKIFVK